jgi:hypothetical protein
VQVELVPSTYSPEIVNSGDLPDSVQAANLASQDRFNV